MTQSFSFMLLSLTLVACRGEVGDQTSKTPATVLSTHHTVSCGGPVFDGEGIGAVRIGARVDSVRSRCAVLSDTTEPGDDGLPTRVITVALAVDTIKAEIDSGRVWRIAISGRGSRTADSLGVGTPLERMLALPAVRGLTGENALYLVSPARCGLSFRVTDPRDDAPSENWTLAMLRKLPPGTVVTEVLIVGCKAVA
jgi:hypothetical protein